MGGGLMQLVAYGAQDIYLTGNPQITFFKVVYRRHTNFAVESIEQTFNGQVDFGKRVTATISRNGDLIQQMYLEAVLPKIANGTYGSSCTWTYGVGNAMINKAEIEIGGQLIDRHYGDWMNIWTELTVPAGKRAGYDNMVGNALTASTEQGSSWDADDSASSTKYRVYVPFQFWFNRNPGLALPLIALQYHEVKLNLELRPITDLVQGASTTVSGSLYSCKLYVDYIYLDTDERRRFAQVSHEYLIEQVQFTGSQTIPKGTSTQNITLNFNHPVKELIWAHVSSNHSTSPSSSVIGSGSWFNYSGLDCSPTGAVGTSGVDSFTTGLLQLNGHDRFYVRYADYFRKVQNYDHHTRVPRVGGDLNDTLTDTKQAVLRQYIYSYSFALSPEEHQPSGTCNFSRIDNAVLQLGYGADPLTNAANASTLLLNYSMNLNIYAVNYNVLRIMSGMGGLAYSN
jgi:Major capsid protein N-terminus/Large eukaryotic DNA virus major capsid protein